MFNPPLWLICENWKSNLNSRIQISNFLCYKIVVLPRPVYFARLETATARSPIAAILGPRQSGKTTLARMFTAGKAVSYFDLDLIPNWVALHRILFEMRPNRLPGESNSSKRNGRASIDCRSTENTVVRGDTLAVEHNLRGYAATHPACALIWQETLGMPVTLASFEVN